MIQFNLLPDVKQEFIKARRMRRSVSLISITSAGAAVVILVILLGIVNGAQKKYINDLNKDITKYTNQIKEINDLDKILTIQNQLNSLTSLHDQKPVASRLFSYMSSLTPAQASIDKLSIDFAAYVISIEGRADSLGVVNKFADTLKFTDYKLKEDSPVARAFSGVVLQSFTRDATTTEFTLNASFDPVIFDSSQDIVLNVPDIISTRSETEKPEAVFSQ